MGVDGKYGNVVSAPAIAHARTIRSIAVVGAGPAGLMAAEVLSSLGYRVVVFDRMASVGRKLLMAGRGGLNLTHSEPIEPFLLRYGPASSAIKEAIQRFSPSSLVSWCEDLGQETFIGSSGRVFPKSFKSSPLLRAWLVRLNNAGVEIRPRHTWTGWDAHGALSFKGHDGIGVTFAPDAVVLALGGASWPRLGSDGRWVGVLEKAGVPVAPLVASNCGVRVAWTPLMKSRHCGEPLKRIAVSLGDEIKRGEAVITQDGLEGNVIYALSGAIRARLDQGQSANLSIDLRPDENHEQLKVRLSGFRGRQSMATFLRKALKLSPAAISLLHEATGGPLPADQMERAQLIKAVPVRVEGLAGLERAISSSGGVELAALDQNFMLRARPGVFLAGEMLDWDAPTGGYLLQACCATGVAAARGIEDWLKQQGDTAAQTCDARP